MNILLISCKMRTKISAFPLIGRSKGLSLLLMSWSRFHGCLQGHFTWVRAPPRRRQNSRVRGAFQCLPDLLCIVEFDLRALLHELGVLLQVFDAPLCMLLQVIKLILQGRERREESAHLNTGEESVLCLQLYRQHKAEGGSHGASPHLSPV